MYINENLEKMVDNIFDNVFEQIVEESLKYCKENLEIFDTEVKGGNYDRFKYELAHQLAKNVLACIPSIKKIAYSDISSGEWIISQTYYGKDLDLLIKTDKEYPVKVDIGKLIEVLDERLRKHIKKEVEEKNRRLEVLEEIVDSHNILEAHVDDFYARTIDKPLSKNNAIVIYDRDEYFKFTLDL